MPKFHYLLRDFTYTVAGGLVFLAALWSAGAELSLLFETATASLLKALLLMPPVGVIAYFLGILVQEVSCMVRVVKTDIVLPYVFATRAELLARTVNLTPDIAFQELARTTFLKHVGASFGGTGVAVAAAALWALCSRGEGWGLLVGGTALAITGAVLSRSKCTQESAILKSIADCALDNTVFGSKR